ncbi:MAG: ATP-binding protein [Gammaproteobacteria bacterium]|nr:ATP-binding protein [Gammaproteobacteria bacterium]
MQEEFTLKRMPTGFVLGVVIVCLSPFVLTLLGFDFGNHTQELVWSELPQLTATEQTNVLFYRLPGAFTHALLEWTAFCAALFTVLLAFSQFRMSGDVTTPIIGMALFCAGSMDAFQTLAAAHLIDDDVANQDLIPFTWVIGRIFNALIMIVGVGLFLGKGVQYRRFGTPFLLLVSLLFILLAYGIISYCAHSDILPQTQYPDNFITRPYDLIPLLLFAFAGLYLYPKFYRQQPSLFAHALIISAVPEVVVQLNMVFGSTALFDHHFNIAHFLKIVAYVVPMLGLTLDYIRTYQEQQRSAAALDELNQKLASSNAELAASNAELEQFAYIASHDLQEPLRTVTSFLQLLQSDTDTKVSQDGEKYLSFAMEGSARMKCLVEGLLDFSRLGSSQTDLQRVDSAAVVQTVLQDLEVSIRDGAAQIEVGRLPMVQADKNLLYQLLQNLLANALKYRADQSKIHIKAEWFEERWHFSVQDNGIGMEQKHHERIFQIFQRLHGQNEYSGVGIGLAMCKKIAERLGGQIWVESELGVGSTFFFSLAAVR